MKVEKIDDLTIGVRYKVTKQSDDETFIVEDIIERNDENDILGYNASGWIDAKNVEKAIKGLEVELHKEYAVKRILKLHEEIKKLYSDYNIIESDFLTEEDFDELDKLNEKLKEEKQ